MSKIEMRKDTGVRLCEEGYRSKVDGRKDKGLR